MIPTAKDFDSATYRVRAARKGELIELAKATGERLAEIEKRLDALETVAKGIKPRIRVPAGK